MNKRIKMLRKSLDLTQQEFANRIGTTANVLTNYETGRRHPSSSVINNICKTFNVNEIWLRTGEGEMFAPQKADALDELVKQRGLSDGDRLLIEKFLNLRPDERQAVIKYLRSIAADYTQPPAHIHEDIEREAEEAAQRYKEQYILEKRQEQQASSANAQDAG